ncbi:hypothetical protein ABZ609_36155, partial [Streptomyces rubiginosohelvolus]
AMHDEHAADEERHALRSRAAARDEDIRTLAAPEGLGSKAVTYGFQRFDNQFMLITVALLIVIVTVIQLIGDLTVRLLARRGRTAS